MAVMLAACSGENQEARTPVASITVNADRLEINQSMEIRFNGVADQVVIFTGDNGHDYDLRNESNTGFVMNKAKGLDYTHLHKAAPPGHDEYTGEFQRQLMNLNL